MSENLLLADIRKAIKDNIGTFITSIDNRIAKWEHADNAYQEAKEKLREEIKRLYVGLERLDDCASAAKAEKIKARMVEIAQQDISAAFAAVIEKYMETVIEYAEFT